MKSIFSIFSKNNIFSVIGFIYLLFTVTVFPLYINLSSGYFSLDIDKITVYLYSSIIFYLFFILFFCFSYLRKKKSFNFFSLLEKTKYSLTSTDYWVLGYSLPFYLLLIFSLQKSAFIGAEGWYLGLLFQLSVVALYFITSCLLTSLQCIVLIYVMISVSSIIFLLGILNRYSINPLGLPSADPFFISTLGNINWIGGYWSLIFPITICFLLFYIPKKKNSSLYLLFYWFFCYSGMQPNSIKYYRITSPPLLLSLFRLLGKWKGTYYENWYDYIQ